MSRLRIGGVTHDRPWIMGILNVTPDSFSDGGQFLAPQDAIAQAKAMVADGADMLDIGGESTRPGATEVPVSEEIDRVVPVIAAIRQSGLSTPISVDTRKAAVARAALDAGADMVNDVSAMTFDPDMARVVAQAQCPICLMHAKGLPETMQANARYDDVVQEVRDHLVERVAFALDQGITADKIILDPGIGFGKTLDHNLALLTALSGLCDIGYPILLGASRKRFIGTITGAQDPQDRMPGSLAVALHGVQQGVQLLRVHDTKATKAAIDMHMALNKASMNDT